MHLLDKIVNEWSEQTTSFVVSPSPWFNGTPRLTMQNSAALWTNCQSECKDSLEDVDFSQKMGHCENVRRGEGPISFGIFSIYSMLCIRKTHYHSSRFPILKSKGLMEDFICVLCFVMLCLIIWLS